MTERRPPRPVAPEFDVLWRGVEPQFRRSLGRFGLADDAADDMMQDVLYRLADLLDINPSKMPTTERGLLRLAEVTAQRLVSNRIKQALRRPAQVSWDEHGPALADMSTADAEAAEESVIDREAVHQALMALDPEGRAVVELIMRGGPYTSTERSSISRARGRLDEALVRLAKLLSVFGGLRLGRLRNRIGLPSGQLSVAAATALATVGLTVGLAVCPSEARQPDVSADAARVAAPARPGPPETPAAETRPAAPVAAVHRGGGATGQTPDPRQSDGRGLPLPVVASATTGSDGERASGVVTVEAPRRANWNGVEFQCDSTVRRLMCEALSAPVPSP